MVAVLIELDRVKHQEYASVGLQVISKELLGPKKVELPRDLRRPKGLHLCEQNKGNGRSLTQNRPEGRLTLFMPRSLELPRIKQD